VDNGLAKSFIKGGKWALARFLFIVLLCSSSRPIFSVKNFEEKKMKKQSIIAILVGITLLLMNVGAIALAQSFQEDFSTSSLDPAWTVTDTYPGHGYYSLTGNSLRYYLQAWSIPTDAPLDAGYAWYYPCMKLSRSFSGTYWIFETKVTYYMPYSNGRDLDIWVCFGSRNNSIEFYKYSDCGYVVNNWVSTIDGVTQLIGNFPIGGTPYETDYFRIVREDKELTLLWSSDGQNWLGLYNTTMSDQTAGLSQYVLLSGQSWATPAGSYAEYDYIYVEPTTIDVTIDVKPGSYPNSINLKSKGNIPVAILSSSAFDATTVDRNTVVFAGASPLSIGQTPEDVNGDGLLDVVLHFKTQDLNLQVGDTKACLSGKTLAGQEFKGCDSVRIVK
jgi:hypothetical protein